MASLLPIPYTVPPLSVISVLGFNDCRCLNCFRLFPCCDYIVTLIKYNVYWYNVHLLSVLFVHNCT
uniref:Uncharacterized protein n=1 Tax=Myoviridae sp. ctkOm7 TaxID=2826690 RepID=A0A8S5NLM8_9CAUD|nr:MAG TPA: hypothetical protein [Myoviridae sp. ctkOm7]